MNKPCRKIPYDSRADAVRMGKKNGYNANKPYQCQHCGCWHFTSQKGADRRAERKWQRFVAGKQAEAKANDPTSAKPTSPGEWKKAKHRDKDRRQRNFTKSLQRLDELGVRYEPGKDEFCVVVKCASGEILDYWPGTGNFYSRTVSENGRGVREVIRRAQRTIITKEEHAA